MEVVYAQEEAPPTLSKSIFLVGPTPRSENAASWRPAAIKALEIHGYNGVVFVPEMSGGWLSNYNSQVEWEKKHLEMADLILAWVPRNLKTMPAFTTNVEFGKYVASGKLLYGRPANAPKTQYLDWLYADHGCGEPYSSITDLAGEAVRRLGAGAMRRGGERSVPLHIWNTNMFQMWYEALGDNRLEDAKVLWSYRIPNRNLLFSYILWVKVWIAAEGRYKENEFIFSRSDISVIVPYWLNLKSNRLLDTKIVLIKEFRSPVRNSTGYVHELPGGSSFKGVTDPRTIAAEELKEETGLDIAAERFNLITDRQLASTLSTHKGILFSVSLTDAEIEAAERLSKAQTVHGVVEDTERTVVEVKTFEDIILTDEVDWSMIGMMFNGIAQHSSGLHSSLPVS